VAIRSVQEYVDSLKDDRVVYCKGERVNDVTQHPSLRVAVQLSAVDFMFTQHPNYRDLLVEKNEEGEPVSFVLIPPRSTSDLLRKRNILLTLGRICHGLSGTITGVDGLNGLSVLCERMDKHLGTEYAERMRQYRRHLQKTQAAVALAMTDVKGDRSLRPSKQVQHRDYYLRIVDDTREGIVVRGAKAHISYAPVANELLVLPCRFMGEDDRDYAVACGVPANAKGVKIVASAREPIEEGNFFDYPLNAGAYAADALVFFEDVFVPTERVFLKREWQFSGQMAYMFANFHRLTGDTYKYLELEVMTGLAALLAEYNGIDKYSHVRDKLTWLVTYTETLEALGRAACEACVKEPGTGLVYPNPMYSNIAKLHFADNFHQAIKHIQDIGGSILATIPHSKDFLSPETGPLLEKYLGGKAGVPTEHRVRAINLAKEYSTNFHLVATLQGEGSLAAQRMSIHALADFERYKAAARRAAWISDGSEHPLFQGLPEWQPMV